jgi:cation diffusion facilitator family transporter
MHEGHIHEYAESHGHGARAKDGERRTLWVVALTFGMMVVEVVAGRLTGSMALFADGIHMATHVGALGMAAVAYYYARTRAHSEDYSFGTGKVYALGGYTSALFLVATAVWMGVDSVLRFFSPEPIQFAEALPVAVVGLLVNLVSAKLLDHDHGHGEAHAPHAHDHGDHDHDHDHDHGHEDHNLKAAYLHVVADAFTSVLAIGALLAGRYLGLTFLDPAMGIVGALVIIHWGVRLSRQAAKQLLDVAPSIADTRTIRAELEAVDDVCVADLHVWDLGPGERSCIVKLVTSSPRDPAYYRELIKAKVRLSHLTVEVQRCTAEHEAA